MHLGKGSREWMNGGCEAGCERRRSHAPLTTCGGERMPTATGQRNTWHAEKRDFLAVIYYFLAAAGSQLEHGGVRVVCSRAPTPPPLASLYQIAGMYVLVYC